MEVLKTKKFNIVDPYDQGLALTLLDAHKFEIDAEDVFGKDFTIYDPQTHLSKTPEALMPFLNLPHEETYFEFLNAPIRLNEGTIGLLAWNTPSGIIRIVPVITIKGITSFVEMSFDLGVKRKLQKGDFDSFEEYNEWKTSRMNKTERLSASLIRSCSLCDESAKNMHMLVTLLIESLMYINAKGVGLTINHPKIKKHIKRKSPFKEWEYKTLRVVRKGEPEVINNHGKNKIPFISRKRREHTVRGHIRQHGTAGPIWISPHVRCKGTEGKIFKDYEIK